MCEPWLMDCLSLAEWRGAVLLALYLAVIGLACAVLPCGADGDNA